MKPCRLCEKGFPVKGAEGAVHYGTQALGLIPDTPCAAAAKPSEACPLTVSFDDTLRSGDVEDHDAHDQRIRALEARVKEAEVKVERLKATCNRYQIALNRKGCSGPWHAGLCCQACKDSWQRGLDAEARAEKAEAAVRWALGENVPGPMFLPRGEHDPPYWWRKELKRRAALKEG